MLTNVQKTLSFVIMTVPIHRAPTTAPVTLDTTSTRSQTSAALNLGLMKTAVNHGIIFISIIHVSVSPLQ